MFSAPKLLIFLGLIFLLILLPAMAGISLIVMRRISRKLGVFPPHSPRGDIRGREAQDAAHRNPEAFLR
jgi:hypothetical protein